MSAAADKIAKELGRVRDYVAVKLEADREVYRGYPSRYASVERDLADIDKALADYEAEKAQPAPESAQQVWELTDEEIKRAVRHLYSSDEAAEMGLKDDLRTARAVLAAARADASPIQPAGWRVRQNDDDMLAAAPTPQPVEKRAVPLMDMSLPEVLALINSMVNTNPSADEGGKL